ncbi:MAG: hypothetical protein Q7R99_02465 [bacterium]|nr:hypothetical protein [bacterium]
MFYIGAIILVLGYYFTSNWRFYIGMYGGISIIFLSVVLFCVLAILNIKRMTKKNSERFLISLSVPIFMLTIISGAILSATIASISNCAEGFGWVLTINEGWQICLKNSVSGGIYGVISLMLFLIFCALSIATYMVCSYKKK